MQLCEAALKVSEQGTTQFESLNVLAPIKEIKNRLSDNNTRVKERATELLLIISQHSVTGMQLVLQELTRPLPAATAKTLWAERLNCCQKILRQDRTNLQRTQKSNEPSIKHCLYLAIAGFSNTKEEVRLASHLVILEIYQIIGRYSLM
jgi:hypothetical protein